jgi:hypothetical protein
MRNKNSKIMSWARNIIIAMAVLFAGGSCNNADNTNRSNESDTAIIEKSETINKQYCFSRISGNQQRDTLAVNLRINNNIVTGEMTDAIFEKDRRRGKLLGKLAEKNITADWTYVQEGAIETVQLQFRLENGQLLMAPLVYNAKTGREEADVNASAWTVVPPSSCALPENERAYTVSGTVTAITPGKDGYMATLKSDHGDTVDITMSRVRLQKNYTTFDIGERVVVLGDTVQLGQRTIVLVDLYKKASKQGIILH